MPKKNQASFNDGQVLLDVNTQGSNLVSFQITNNHPTEAAIFYVYNSAILNGNPIGSVVVWSITQGPLSTGAVTNFPSVDNNGTAIDWQLGQVTLKDGTTDTTVVNPQWSFTMLQ